MKVWGKFTNTNNFSQKRKGKDFKLDLKPEIYKKETEILKKSKICETGLQILLKIQNKQKTVQPAPDRLTWTDPFDPGYKKQKSEPVSSFFFFSLFHLRSYISSFYFVSPFFHLLLDFSGQTHKNPPSLSRSPHLQYSLRLIALGDVHGDLNKTKQALRLANLIDSSDRWIGASATLVQVGDVLDRGGQELRILYFLEKPLEPVVASSP